MSSLPEELAVELLSKLPAKSLFRFRCVSKQWLYLLSSSSQGPRSLKNLHNKRHNRTPFLLAWNDARYDKQLGRQGVRPDVPKRQRGRDGYTHYRMYMYVIDMFTNKLHHAFTFEANEPLKYQNIVPCHGLVFFTGVNRDNRPSALNYVIHVCNPSTGETIKLPNSYINCRYRTGFGYLPSVNQYKVVSWFDGNYEGFEIITLIDGGKADSYSWRSVKRSRGYLGLQYRHLCVNGVIYWLTRDQTRMLAIDLENEKYEIISIPSPGVGHWELIELRGSLCLAECMKSNTINTIWMLDDNDKKYYSEWTINKIWMLNDKEYYSEWNPTYDIREWFAYLTDDRKQVVKFVSWRDTFSRLLHNTRIEASLFELRGIPNLVFGIFELHPYVYFDSLFSLNESVLPNMKHNSTEIMGVEPSCGSCGFFFWPFGKREK